MNGIRRVFLTALLLSNALPVQADQEAYSAEVCNTGQLGVEVAVAYTAFGLIDEYWVVDGWYRVPPGQCKTVFSHPYEQQSKYAEFRRSFPVHLAFAFTDSTGVWGSANVRPPKDVAASRLQLCVTRKNFEYKVEAKDPASACHGQSGSFLIRASIDHEPKHADYYNRDTGVHYRGLQVAVALGPNDRAIPLGPHASIGGAAQGPGTSDEFIRLLRAAVNALPASEQTLGPGGYVQLKLGYRWVDVCASREVVSRESLSNLSTARAKAITNATKQFLASHGKGKIGFRVTDLNGAVALEQFDGKTEECVHRGDLQYQLQSAETAR